MRITMTVWTEMSTQNIIIWTIHFAHLQAHTVFHMLCAKKNVTAKSAALTLRNTDQLQFLMLYSLKQPLQTLAPCF